MTSWKDRVGLASLCFGAVVVGFLLTGLMVRAPSKLIVVGSEEASTVFGGSAGCAYAYDTGSTTNYCDACGGGVQGTAYEIADTTRFGSRPHLYYCHKPATCNNECADQVTFSCN